MELKKLKDKSLTIENMVIVKTYSHESRLLECPFCGFLISAATMQVEMVSTNEKSDWDSVDWLDTTPPKEEKIFRFQCLHCGGKLEINSDNVQSLMI